MTDPAAQPKRIQLSRAKGWRKPEGAIVVSRPSEWGNAYPAVTPEVQRIARTAAHACPDGTSIDFVADVVLAACAPAIAAEARKRALVDAERAMAAMPMSASRDMSTRPVYDRINRAHAVTAIRSLIPTPEVPE